MNPGECPEITTGYKIPIKQITGQDTTLHPVSYVTEHNSWVHSRWIEIPLSILNSSTAYCRKE